VTADRAHDQGDPGPRELEVLVNGRPTTMAAGATVAAIVAALQPGGGGGMAVAINEELVPRSQWEERTLAAHDRVEVLTAAQGG
jgi:sulfur carrier protein